MTDNTDLPNYTDAAPEAWQPIATVPRDGTVVVVWMPGNYPSSASYGPHSDPQGTHWIQLAGPETGRSRNGH